MRRRFASPSTEKPRFLCLFQRKSPHNFCTKILHRTSCDRVGWSGCRLPQISPISTDKLHSACEESVFICRADDWQAPRMASVFLCAICGRNNVPHGPFRIPHLTLHVIDHPLPAKECRFAAPMARSVLLVSSPHGICVPQCDLWAYKTPAWPHSIIPHPTDHSTFNVQHSTFHIPHTTLYTLSLGSCQSSLYHLAPVAVAPLTPAPTICGVCGPQRCASPFPQLPSGKGFPPAHIIVLQW